MSSVIQRIDSVVRSNRITAFTKSHCPHSAAAKAALSSAGVKFHAEDIDKWDEKDMNEAQDHFMSTTGARSVPRIFIDGKCVGGNSDFQAAYVQTGKLKEFA
jgi:glutaredoxin 3